jgi:hypothetical protein
MEILKSVTRPSLEAANDQQISKWRVTSKRFGLKTIDLFSNRAWTKTQAKNYKVSLYPHYFLINADGKIIENFTDRPSQEIASKIEKALAENEDRHGLIFVSKSGKFTR